jgi:hypothetical protein
LDTEKRINVPTSGIIVSVNEADGWDKDINDELKFAAYCVNLENVSINHF